MTWRAWVNRETGQIDRVFSADEPTPDFSEAAHELMPLTDQQYAEAKAGKDWDARAKVFVDPPPPRAAPEPAEAQRELAQRWVEKLPPGVIDLLAELLAKKLSERGGRNA